MRARRAVARARPRAHLPLLPRKRKRTLASRRPRRGGPAAWSGRTSRCCARTRRCRRGSASSRAAATTAASTLSRGRPRAPRSRAIRRADAPAAPRRTRACASYLVSSRTARQLRVVAVLLAPARVAAGRLQVAVGLRADPDVGPRRRDRERADAPDHRGIAERPAVRQSIAEAFAAPDARDARGVVAHRHESADTCGAALFAADRWCG